ncbi:MAG: hypothetical protein P9M15_00080 [Candidatus Electryoneaceae bacterium]|nr:hypothetical protein [Candidatus Electryoneaceae bacterium]
MAVKYTDSEIEEMIQEPKPLPQGYHSKIQLRSKRGHKERELDVEGVRGNQYRVILRQSMINILDFSIILAVIPPKSNQLFRLRRHNGKSHRHTNTIERNRFFDFHIHQATERYQAIDIREDDFAEPTDRYSDVHSAIQCLLQDCGFVLPDEAQTSLFRGL